MMANIIIASTGVAELSEQGCQPLRLSDRSKGLGMSPYINITKDFFLYLIIL